MNSWITAVALVAMAFSGSPAEAAPLTGPILTCPAVRDRTQDFLRRHVAFRSFDAALARRVFDKFLAALDPTRSVLLASDIEALRAHETRLGDEIGRADCSFIDQAQALYHRRLGETSTLVETILQQPLGLEAAETVALDAKARGWPKSPEARQELWRHELKSAALTLRHGDPKLTDAQIAARLRDSHAASRKAAAEQTSDDLGAAFLIAFAAALDAHSWFMLPAARSDYNTFTSLQFNGIGANLRQVGGLTLVEALTPGGSAARDGRLRKGDQVAAVDAGDGAGPTDVNGLALDKIIRMIRGKRGTVVKLVIRRKNAAGQPERLTLELVRELVRMKDGEARSEVVAVDGRRLGVLTLPSFYIDREATSGEDHGSGADTERELKKLLEQKVDGIVLDLRYNRGGDMNQCAWVAGLFLDRGRILRVRGRDGYEDFLTPRNPAPVYRGPLVVLISRISMSASEILAGVLQDRGRALIVGGSHTYGKGTVQHSIDVPGTAGREVDGNYLVTVYTYYLPSGRSPQEHGVAPDIVVPDQVDETSIGEMTLEYALPGSSSPPLPELEPSQSLRQLLPELTARSAARLRGPPAPTEAATSDPSLIEAGRILIDTMP